VTRHPKARPRSREPDATISLRQPGALGHFVTNGRFNGTDPAGRGRTNTLTLANVQEANEGNYDVVVANGLRIRHQPGRGAEGNQL